MLVLPSEWPLKTIAVKISFDIDAETATMSKQRSTLSKELFDCRIRQCYFDIVAGVDGALALHYNKGALVD